MIRKDAKLNIYSRRYEYEPLYWYDICMYCLCQINCQVNTIKHTKQRIYRYDVMNQLEMTMEDEKIAVITHRLINAMKNYSSPGKLMIF